MNVEYFDSLREGNYESAPQIVKKLWAFLFAKIYPRLVTKVKESKNLISRLVGEGKIQEAVQELTNGLRSSDEAIAQICIMCRLEDWQQGKKLGKADKRGRQSESTGYLCYKKDEYADLVDTIDAYRQESTDNGKFSWYSAAVKVLANHGNDSEEEAAATEEEAAAPPVPAKKAKKRRKMSIATTASVPMVQV